MKTLINKANPAIRVTVPDGMVKNRTNCWAIWSEGNRLMLLDKDNWTLVEEEPVDIMKEIDRYFGNYKDPVTKEKYRKSTCWLNHRQAIKFARHFYELGKKGGSK